MAIKSKDNTRIIDLDGPDGNAYALMEIAQSWLKQMGLDPQPVITEMMSGDYKNLVRVFNRKFGNIVELQTSQKDLLDLESE